MNPMVRLLSIAAVLSAPASATAAAACSPPSAAPPLRRAGTAVVRLSGSRAAEGTYQALCGAYLLADTPGVGKAGDGIVFQTCIPGVGSLQVSGAKRTPGRSKDAGLVLNTETRSYVAAADGENVVTTGADLFSASVKATLRPLRRPKPGAPAEEVVVDARFDCAR